MKLKCFFLGHCWAFIAATPNRSKICEKFIQKEDTEIVYSARQWFKCLECEQYKILDINLWDEKEAKK